MCSEKSKPCDLYVGAETGLIKGIKICAESKSWTNLNSVEAASRDKEITALCWKDAEQTEFCVGLRDQTVAVYGRKDEQLVTTLPGAGGDARLKALAPLNDAFITCTDKGDLEVTKLTETVLSVNVGDHISCMCQNESQRHLVATGGKENELKIWNLEQHEEPIFKAKNVRNDFLDLRVPVWVTDAAFLPDSQKVVTCTGHHQVRMYDPLSPQRRPVMDLEVDEYPLISMSLRPGYQQALVGDTHGTMSLVDFRGKAYVVQRYKGFAGSIRSIQCHPHNGTVASCGLDRFLRIHDVNSRELVHKIYLKSRLNCVLVADDWDSQSEASINTAVEQSAAVDQDSDDMENNEDDTLWENMDVVGGQRPQKVKVEKVDEDSGAYSEEMEDSEEAKEQESTEAEVTRKRTRKPKHKDTKSKKKTKTK